MKLFNVIYKIAPVFIYAIYSSQSLSAKIPNGAISIANSNMQAEISQEFSLKKIASHEDLNKLPEEFRKLVLKTHEYDYFYAISPTKSSGGYIFEIEISKKDYQVCLRAPKPMSAVTTALTTPIALIKLQKGFKIEPVIVECK